MPGASGSPCLHGTPAMAGNAYFTIIKLCGGFYNSKKQNLFKKTDKKSQLLHKTKIKSRNGLRTLFFKVRCRPKATRKRMSFAPRQAYLSKKPCVTRLASSPSQSSLRDARFPLLSLRDIFPRPGEVGPQSGSPWQSTQSSSFCQGLSLWERWHGVSRDGEGEPADQKTSLPTKKAPPFGGAGKAARL